MPWISYADSIPTTKLCKKIRIPDDPYFLAAVNGALLELSRPWNQESFGNLTPEQVADMFLAVATEFSLEPSDCMVGKIVMCCTATIPENTLICDGSEQLRVNYPDLYEAISPSLKIDDDTFILPMLIGTFPLGVPYDPTGFALTVSGGEQDVTLSIDQIPSHTHSDSGHLHSTHSHLPGVAVSPGELPISVPNIVPEATSSGNADISYAGGGLSHNNMPPFSGVFFVIYYR